MHLFLIRKNAPVINIDSLDATNQQLELLLIKHPQFFEGDNLAQPVLERLDLFLDSPSQAVLAEQPNVLELVRLGDGDLGPVRDQLARLEGPERVVLRREIVIEHVGDVVLSVCGGRRVSHFARRSASRRDSRHPGQRSKHFCVDERHVFQPDRSVQARFVDAGGEMRIDETAMEDSHAERSADKGDCRALVVSDFG